jgi:hypothetical protein
VGNLLDKAMEEISKLSEHDQDAIGAWLLEELGSERRWVEAFASTEEKLAALADAALEEHRAGRTRGLEPKRL